MKTKDRLMLHDEADNLGDRLNILLSEEFAEQYLKEKQKKQDMELKGSDMVQQGYSVPMCENEDCPNVAEAVYDGQDLCDYCDEMYRKRDFHESDGRRGSGLSR